MRSIEVRQGNGGRGKSSEGYGLREEDKGIKEGGIAERGGLWVGILRG